MIIILKTSLCYRSLDDAHNLCKQFENLVKGMLKVRRHT